MTLFSGCVLTPTQLIITLHYKDTIYYNLKTCICIVYTCINSKVHFDKCFSVKLSVFSHPSVLRCVVGVQNNVSLESLF